MINHFPTEIAAINHLMGKGFTELENHFWVSAYGDVKASIHPITGSTWVMVAFSLIQGY